MCLHKYRRFGLFFSLLGLLLITLLFSCGRHNKPGASGFADEDFADELSNLLQPVDTATPRKMRPLSDDLRLVYQLEDYQPIWVKENYKPRDAAGMLLEELEEMQWDGADTGQYNITAIRNLKTKLDTTKRNSLADAIRFDTSLTRSYLAAARFLLLGSVLPKKADSLWYQPNDSVWQAPKILASSEKYPSLNDFRSAFPTYELLRKEYKRYYELMSDSSYVNSVYNVQQPDQDKDVLEYSANYIILAELTALGVVSNDSISDDKQLVMAYQRNKMLRVTGKLDSSTIAGLATGPEVYAKKLCANMERLRWMQQTPGEMYILVNVPLMELFFRRGAEEMMHKKVVVGRPERQTPSLRANMTNIVINPPWGVPPTILKNDVLPGIQKSGKKYLAKKGLKVYDKNGNAVNASNITSSNYRRYTYKQAPGDDNSLGYVKFNMPNKWNIYLHDTPHREDFGKRGRALSSGCVRVNEPQEMALFILAQLEDKQRYTQGRLDTLIASHKTKSETLKNKIPVFITYLTAFEDSTGQRIQFSKDIYEKDEKLMAMMK